jgi:BlaI family penicillinase repressor
MAKSDSLSRRERQIMDVLYRMERATAAEIQTHLDPPPHYSTVRTQLRVLEEKGHLRHEEDGLRYVYVPVINRNRARRSALRHLVETFFEGSAGNAVAALLGGEVKRLTAEELERISRMVVEAGRRSE